MLRKRLIPCLLLRNNKIVKGYQFSNHKYIGDPKNAVRIFSDRGADEIVFINIGGDISNDVISFISKVCDQSFTPFSVGGGIRKIEDVFNILRSGAEKVIINSWAVDNPAIINEISKKTGRQSIVISIDVKKEGEKYTIYSLNGMKKTNLTLKDWIYEVVDRGAGEIFLTDINREGTFLGFDDDLISQLPTIGVPFIFHGGINSLENAKSLLTNRNIDAVACGSLFILQKNTKSVLINYPTRNKLEV